MNEPAAAYEAARDRYYKTGKEQDFNEAMRRFAAWNAATKRESENRRPPDRPTGIEARVCADIAARQRVGLAKYGVSVAESPDDMLRHAMEEAYDLSVYLRAEWERRQWQPIETVPVSARSVLIHCPLYHNTFVAENGSGQWRHFGGGGNVSETPSHWMPLPNPPA